MKKILLAFQFLTIIPVKGIKEVSEKEVGKSSAFFPLVGFVQGLFLMVSAGVFLKVFPAELVSGLIILMIILLNGGLHLDGLADTFDAIAARGNKEKKLAVMKDGSVGPTGVTAIVIVILLKFLLLNIMLRNSSPSAYYTSLFLMPIFSRWIMVPAIFHGKSARRDGLGRIFIENTGLKELVIATFLVISCWLLVAGFLSLPFVSTILLMLPLLYIFGLLSVKLSNKMFGGMTGDTFGAVSEISEILFLMNAVLWLKNSI